MICYHIDFTKYHATASDNASDISVYVMATHASEAIDTAMSLMTPPIERWVVKWIHSDAESIPQVLTRKVLEHYAARLGLHIASKPEDEFGVSVEHIAAAARFSDPCSSLKWAADTKATVDEMRAWDRAVNGKDMLADR
jgi:hypothetical protein